MPSRTLQLLPERHFQNKEQVFYIQHSLIESTQIDEKTIGQFIGLKDGNNKEIYDGDIVKDAGGDLYVVRFNEFKFQLDYFPEGGEAEFNIDEYELEIIGNIYENPELMGNE